MTRGRELRDELVPRAAAVRERNITRPGTRMDAPCCFCLRSSLSPTDAAPTFRAPPTRRPKERTAMASGSTGVPYGRE
jgi:hypothetical protein